MRSFIAIVLIWFASPLAAQEWEDRRVFNKDASKRTLRIISSTDTALFASIIESFISVNPDVAVEYLVAGTSDIEQRVRASPASFDVIVSSAMDLQLKMANDGLARMLPELSYPSWAHWRKSLFAFTSEPAAIVINKAAFAGHPVPKTRQELITSLRARPEIFEGRVGTYDVRRSGLGYLFATQDARVSETFWRLMEVMGALDVKLYCCSGDMIDDLSDGTIAVAYNVLGSYALARVKSGAPLEIILPADFPTTMMRTAFTSAQAPDPEMATAFIAHLITRGGVEEVDGGLPALAKQAGQASQVSIALEPSLLTFLDTMKRRRFLAEWENAVIQR